MIRPPKLPPPTLDVNVRLAPKRDAAIFTYTLDAPGGGAVRVEVVLALDAARALARALNETVDRAGLVVVPSTGGPPGLTS